MRIPALNHPRSAFTMIELLVSILIVAALTAVAMFAYISLTRWAQQTNDKRTLVVLNDALTRYKTEGGSLAALTSGAPIGDVLALMHSPVTWGNLTHQVMQNATTYQARSISSTDNGALYHFYRYNTYTDTNAPAPPAAGPSSPGAGVGQMTNGSHSGGYSVTFTTSGTSYIACKDNSGAITYVNSGSPTSLPVADSYLFWACAGNADPTLAGAITLIDCSSNHLTSLNVTGLTGLNYLQCGTNQLTSINVASCSSLQDLFCDTNQLTSIDISGLTSLQQCTCNYNLVTSVNVTGCTGLNVFNFVGNPITSVNINSLPSLQYVYASNCTLLTSFECDLNALIAIHVDGCTALTTLICGENPSLSTLDVSGAPSIQVLSCQNCALSSINISGCTALQQIICWNNMLSGSMDVTSCTGLTYFDCSSNSLSSISVNGLFSLNTLRCFSNSISSIDITDDSILPAQSTDGSTAFYTDVGVSVSGP